MSRDLKIEKAQRKVDPKLRVVANGNASVNRLRAAQSGSVRVAADEEEPPLERPLEPTARAEMTKAQLTTTKLPKDEDVLAAETSDIEYSVFVQLRHSGPARLDQKTAQSRDLVTAVVKATDIGKLETEQSVAFIEPGQTLTAPTPEITSRHGGTPERAVRNVGAHQLHGNGRNVLVGIIDVEGFDFAHPDFLDGRRTRFHSIWDQGGRSRLSPRRRRRGKREFQDYGSELTADDLNAAIAESAHPNSPVFGVAPWRLEPQSQRVPGSHGTHVASIAAGNLGVASRAFIAGVLISLGAEASDRRSSFYDSVNIAHAVDYLFGVAAELGRIHNADGTPLPVSINISLGTNGHAHDASSAVSRWIDYALTVPGRSVCVAAGNAGQAVPEAPGDIGFVMGRVHSSGQFTATDLLDELEWRVVGNTIADVSENEMEIWYSSQDRFSVEVKPPGLPWIGPVAPGEFIENHQLPTDTFISVYNDLYYPANGDNRIGIYLSPFFAESGQILGIPAGTWLVRIRADQVRDGRYHAWIERDDPRRLGPIGPLEAWRFPSFFSELSHVDDSTVSSLACGRRIVSVANYDKERRRINHTSSEGPTRLGEFKPDIAADGTNVIAANGFSPPGDDWVGMTGTSMASPYVAGVIALMLAVNPNLTAAQIGGILRRTSRPLPGQDFHWKKDSGYGLIDGDRCLAETVAYRALPGVRR